MLYLPVLLTMAALSQAHPVTNTQQEGHNKPTIDGQARQVLLPAPQFPAELLLQPQFQYHHGFNLGGDKQFPRYQPQVILLAGGGPPGQPFLLQPGAPPGNFLVPQQPPTGPGLVYRTVPQRPVYVAGYPKPAHIPSIEKDAEEVPSLAGNHPTKSEARHPEKLETFNESPNTPTQTKPLEGGALATANPKPFAKHPPTVKPGQRFFILNGNQLYSQQFPFQQPVIAPPTPFPNHGFGVPQDVFGAYKSFSQPPPQQPYFQHPHPQLFEHAPIQNLFLRNSVTGQISDVRQHEGGSQDLKPYNEPQPQDLKQGYPHPATSLVGFHPQDQQELKQNVFLKQPLEVHYEPYASGLQKLPAYLEKDYDIYPVVVKALPDLKKAKEQPNKFQSRINEKDELDGQVLGSPEYLEYPPGGSPYYQYVHDFNGSKDEDDSVVIDAKFGSDSQQNSLEAIKPSEAKIEEPPISQAQPSAVALAGPGGVATADPKGTALAGQGGLAIAKPQATAIAGPSKDEDNKKRPTKLRQ